MRYSVVDTNVLGVADGGSPQADERCEVAAVESLEQIRHRSSLVLDYSYLILGEYQGLVERLERSRGTGQPGPGGLFFRWATQSADIRRVTITCHPDRGFEEFPQDPRLARFDPDDRKFVATVVKAGRDVTELVYAVDRGYSDHRTALREVRVRELCPHVIRRDR